MHPVQVPCLVSEEEEERRLQSDVSFDIWNEGLELEDTDQVKEDDVDDKRAEEKMRREKKKRREPQRREN